MSRDKHHILVVDGDRDFLDIVDSLLRLAGYAVTAGDAIDAMTAIRSFEPDLIISEWTLPMMDGRRLVKWSREETGYTGPILILTAMKHPGVESRILGAGADGVLFKPAGPSLILDRVQDLLL